MGSKILWGGLAAVVVLAIAIVLFVQPGCGRGGGDEGGNGNQATQLASPTGAPTPTATGTATATASTNGQAATMARQETGKGASLPFPAGASVLGFKIQLNNGSTLQSCYLAKAPSDGIVTDGVLGPNDKEVSSASPCQGVPAVAQQTGSSQNGIISGSTVYGQPPQLYVPHPAFYVETGIVNTRQWSIQVDNDKVLIVGGVSVDGVGGGVYKAFPGGQTINVNITNGFASVVTKYWYTQEWCFRIGEAVRYGWAHANEFPLPGTSCLPSR